MPTTDIYHIAGNLKPARKAVAYLGGAVDDQVQIDAFGAARVTANDTAGTFTAWVNVPDITGDYSVISCGDASAIEYISISVKAGKVRIQCFDATTEQYDHSTTSVVITPHKWHHIAVTQNAATGAGDPPKIYVDGVKKATTMADETDNGTWFDDCALIDGATIGGAEEAGDASITKEFKGAISDVKYWKVELTAAQVAADYRGETPSLITGTTTDLTDWWDFDGDYINSVTAANNGTKVGDITLIPSYCEFTSRLRYDPLAAIVVADKICFAVDGDAAHAIVIKAA